MMYTLLLVFIACQFVAYIYYTFSINFTNLAIDPPYIIVFNIIENEPAMQMMFTTMHVPRSAVTVVDFKR